MNMVALYVIAPIRFRIVLRRRHPRRVRLGREDLKQRGSHVHHHFLLSPPPGSAETETASFSATACCTYHGALHVDRSPPEERRPGFFEQAYRRPTCSRGCMVESAVHSAHARSGGGLCDQCGRSRGGRTWRCRHGGGLQLAGLWRDNAELGAGGCGTCRSAHSCSGARTPYVGRVRVWRGRTACLDGRCRDPRPPVLRTGHGRIVRRRPHGPPIDGIHRPFGPRKRTHLPPCSGSCARPR